MYFKVHRFATNEFMEHVFDFMTRKAECLLLVR